MSVMCRHDHAGFWVVVDSGLFCALLTQLMDLDEKNVKMVHLRPDH